MSFGCKKCFLSFSTKKHLKNHQSKSVPCDFKCNEKGCEFTGGDRHAYYRHKKTHVVKDNKEVTQILQDAPQIQIVPIEDFNSDTLRESMRKHATNIQYHSANSLMNTITGLGNLGVAEVSITTYEIRAEELRKMIGDDMLVCVLKSFEFDTTLVIPEQRVIRSVEEERIALIKKQMRPYAYNPDEQLTLTPVSSGIDDSSFSQMITELLTGVHASKDKRLHSICMGDISRKSVNFYSRSEHNDKPYWQINTKEMSIKKLQVHAKELYKFIAESVTASLKPGYIKETLEFVWYLSAHERIYAITDKELQFKTVPIEAEEDDLLDMMNSYYQQHMMRLPGGTSNESCTCMKVTVLNKEDITECVDGEYLLERNAIGRTIDGKKAHLLAKLNVFQLDIDKCMKFFNESYPVCVDTLKTTRRKR